MRVTHLNKGGKGMAAMTACGRNILRTPVSTDWQSFKADAHQCERCAASKQADLNRRKDAESEAPLVDDNGGTEWVAEDPAVTFARDAEMIAAHRARKAT